jgi:hypothetical protein
MCFSCKIFNSHSSKVDLSLSECENVLGEQMSHVVGFWCLYVQAEAVQGKVFFRLQLILLSIQECTARAPWSIGNLCDSFVVLLSFMRLTGAQVVEC